MNYTTAQIVAAGVGAERTESATAATVAAQFGRDVTPLLGPLYRQALRMTFARADAEDLLQETVLNAYCGIKSFQPGTNLNAWLRRIMTNTYISGYRKKQRRPVQQLTDEITDRQLATGADRSPAGLPSAEDQALGLLPDSDIKSAMMKLPEQFRMAVYFADVAGYSYKEIAAMMNIEQGTVSSRLNRGRRQLRNVLGDAYAPQRADVDDSVSA